MLLTNNMSLRPAQAFAARIQPHSVLIPCAAAAYSTSARPAWIARPPPNTAVKRTPIRSQSPVRHSKCSQSLTPIRCASTSTSSSPAAAATSPAPSSDESTLSWNRFLELRKTRRRISLVSSILGSGVCTMAGVQIITAQDIDSWGAQAFGLDPILVLGLSTMGFTAIGWLIGPFFGNTLFNLYYRKLMPQMAAKEREFYARIKKHRVDPSTSSLNNPPPDFYGEKIGSVGEYRRWLKDQRAFNLKRGKDLL